MSRSTNLWLSLLPLASSFIATSAVAQITPALDGTGTVIAPRGAQTNITGGSLSGDGRNLFHSFERFDLNAQQTATFRSAPGIQNILGRVSGNASLINGLIQVTGSTANLFLINPSGILFGPNTRLNLPGAFTATTATEIGFGNRWWNAFGRNNYSSLVGNPQSLGFALSQPGAIANFGDLAVKPGQNLTLVGGTVLNAGTLTTSGGNITIASVAGGRRVRISQTGTLMHLELEAAPPNQFATAEPFNPTSLPALLTGGDRSEANRVTVAADGTVRLTRSSTAVATTSGATTVSGQVDVSGNVGGSIDILGTTIALQDANLDASGTIAGGNIRIGGDFRGLGPLPTANATWVDRNSSLKTNALTQGNGGQLVLWADKTTRFDGTIQARGGISSGDGGTVEVSGKDTLIFRGDVDTIAPQGKTGTLLLDPQNIVVANGAGAVDDAQLGDGEILSADGGASTFTISEQQLESLSGDTNVILEATNNITINDLADNVLNFQTGIGSVTFNAGGLFSMDAGDTIRASQRSVNITAASIDAGTIDTSTTLQNSNGGAINLTATNGEIAAANLNSDASVLVGNSGNAGTINATATIRIRLNDVSANASTTDASNSGRAGAINLTASGLVAAGNISAIAQDASGTTANSQAISITGDGINLMGGAGSVAGRSITLQPSTPTQNVKLGDLSGTSALDLGSDDLAALQDGFSSITIGRADGSGEIFLVENITFTDPVTLRSPNGSINTNGSDLNGIDNASFILSANQGITIHNIDTQGGSISLTADQGISINDIDTQGGSIFLTAGQGITIDDVNTQGGSVSLTSDNNIIADSIITETNAGAGGDISLQSQGGTITTNTLNTSGSTDGGDISIIADSQIITGTIDTLGGAANGGDVVLSSAGGNIQTDAINTQGNNSAGDVSLNSAGNIQADTINTQSDLVGGDVSLNSTGGTIQTDAINTRGNNSAGDVALGSAGDIRTDVISAQSDNVGGNLILDSTGGSIQSASINTQADNVGGNVTLNSPGNIQTESINAQSDLAGGNINITAGSFFRATDTFSASDGSTVSLSTIGNNNGGSIIIRHAGNGTTPFDVGNSAINGTDGAITTGNATITASQSFPVSEIRGNLSILTQAPPTPPVPPPTPPVPPPTPPVLPPTPPASAPSDQSAQPPSLPNLSFVSPSQETLKTLLKEQSGIEKKDTLEAESRVTQEFQNYLKLPKREQQAVLATLTQTQSTLRQVELTRGLKSALLYVQFKPAQLSGSASLANTSNPVDRPKTARDTLELVLVTADGEPIRRHLVEVNRAQVLPVVQQLQQQITDATTSPHEYLPPAQQLYDWMIAPVRTDLKQRGIQNVTFILDNGLRSIPVAALHNGKNFLVQDYSVGLMPSFSLTKLSDRSLDNQPVLAMGASEFKEQNQLPAVPLELSTITQKIWTGKSLLNDDFTIQNLKSQRSAYPFKIVHLATHGNFRPGKASNSYIQFWDQKLALDQMRQLGLQNPPVELLVLSACTTALGDEKAELGFAGMAVQAGVISSLASLWSVSDEATLGLMTEFYQKLQNSRTKVEALRQAQLAMINNKMRIENGRLINPNAESVELPPALANSGTWNFEHPLYWSAFTLIGSPW
ncbi:CHAT domain-containing protein [filamentous cyanobacterium LEGE 11480]|uniref:CHAT domain-containing protein n=1 Tax=Romeriopsis navalis LEGE 11480 TaxID=2777977 RepID=A0A928VQM5_9CYAN|nr:CHAT domain-containing protein [Romeriopsis navalis]MBE9032886.1 CHAT domain-containing protein [Romeriopsis navalis LEGE 11480]